MSAGEDKMIAVTVFAAGQEHSVSRLGSVRHARRVEAALHA